MKKMKNVQSFVLLAVLFFYCFSFHMKAQEIMNIHKKNNSVISIPVAEIEMITFSGSEIAAESTVIDIEGNIYKTIRIGGQLWMAENLKTKTFNDGTPIQLVTDNKAWYNMKTPAYCWYNNDESTNKNKYGALYNWYAAGSGKLCPLGWHVSSDNDWQELENYLVANGHNSNKGTSEMIGKSLAAKTGWNPSSMPSDVGSDLLPEFINKSGFSALPGGFRTTNGGFSSPEGIGGYWWTSTEKNENQAWFKNLINYRGTLEEVAQSKYFGCSIRCVKND